MRYRQLVHFIVEARDDRDAAEVAKKLDRLLKTHLCGWRSKARGSNWRTETGVPSSTLPSQSRDSSSTDCPSPAATLAHPCGVPPDG